MKIVSAKEIKVIPESEIPHGEHLGIWGGYVVKFSVGNTDYIVEVDQGIRTPKAACKIVISENGIDISAL